MCRNTRSREKIEESIIRGNRMQGTSIYMRESRRIMRFSIVMSGEHRVESNGKEVTSTRSVMAGYHNCNTVDEEDVSPRELSRVNIYGKHTENSASSYFSGVG